MCKLRFQFGVKLFEMVGECGPLYTSVSEKKNMVSSRQGERKNNGLVDDWML